MTWLDWQVQYQVVHKFALSFAGIVNFFSLLLFILNPLTSAKKRRTISSYIVSTIFHYFPCVQFTSCQIAAGRDGADQSFFQNKVDCARISLLRSLIIGNLYHLIAFIPPPPLPVVTDIETFWGRTVRSVGYGRIAPDSARNSKVISRFWGENSIGLKIGAIALHTHSVGLHKKFGAWYYAIMYVLSSERIRWQIMHQKMQRVITNWRRNELWRRAIRKNKAIAKIRNLFIMPENDFIYYRTVCFFFFADRCLFSTAKGHFRRRERIVYITASLFYYTIFPYIYY